MSRRSLLAGAGAVAAASTVAVGVGSAASASSWWGYSSVVPVVTDESWLYELACLPNLRRVYAANPWTNTSTREPRHTIRVVNAGASRLVGEVNLGAGSAFGLTANQETDMVYAGDQIFTELVYAIDGRTNQVVRTAEVAGQPRGLAVNPVTNKLYVTLTNQGRLAVLDGATLAVEASIEIGLIEPAKVAVNPVTNMVYVSNANRRGSGSSVTVIDGATNTITANVPVDMYALGISVNAADNKIYVSNYTSETLSVIDGRTLNIVGKAYVGGSPTAVEYNAVTKKVYVTNFEQKGAVTVIDDIAHTVTRLRVRPAALGLAVNQKTGAVYSSSQTEGSVFLMNPL
ncbi:YncE family protein [Micromonospora craniellae]|uniref:YncE family protein n=1 Tax=Micromonospora craniellae TaxID=2294034 RepID=A0A372G6Z0_9ACTN|nr:YncE family protein [Micromonospora craniellae]